MQSNNDSNFCIFLKKFQISHKETNIGKYCVLFRQILKYFNTVLIVKNKFDLNFCISLEKLSFGVFDKYWYEFWKNDIFLVESWNFSYFLYVKWKWKILIRFIFHTKNYKICYLWQKMCSWFWLKDVVKFSKIESDFLFLILWKLLNNWSL